MRCKSIKKIRIDYSNLNHDDYAALYDILKLSSKVSEVSFEGNPIDVIDMPELFNALSSKKLNTIKFIDNWIGEKVPTEFFSFLKKKQLTTLDMSLNWLRDAGVQRLLDAIETHTELNELKLSCNDCSLIGLKVLRRFVINHPSLKVLE
ncbi:MAG: hypothetical protein ACRCXC_09245 [Legionella sp.]